MLPSTPTGHTTTTTRPPKEERRRRSPPRVVSFQFMVDVREIPPRTAIDPKIKHKLYYSEYEYLVMRAEAKRVKKLLKFNDIYLLQQEKNATPSTSGTVATTTTTTGATTTLAATIRQRRLIALPA